MDPIIPVDPVSSLAGESTTRAALMEKLAKGEWNYPEVELGETEANYSLLFDIILIACFAITWVIASFMDEVPKNGELTRKDVLDYCNKGFLKGPKFSGLNKYVCFFTIEEVTTWVGAAAASLVVLFKILCGASKVNAGYILFVALGAAFTKFTRQGIKGKTKKQVPTLLLIFSLILSAYAYSDVFGGENKDKRNVGFLFAGVAFWIAAVWKTYVSTININSDAEEVVDALMSHDFAYSMTGLTTAVFGTAATFFVFCEMIFVSYAATRWYGIPFYVLYVIPVYSFCMVVWYDRVRTKRLIFNIVVVIFGTAALAFAHLHVCSFPGPDGKHVVAGCLPYGLKELSDDHDKFEYMDGSLELPMIFSAFFIVLVYAGAAYSKLQLTTTLNELCSSYESEKLPEKTEAPRV